MTIRLPETLQHYVRDQVRSGHYDNANDVIVDTLERHRQTHQHNVVPLERTDEPTNQELQRRLFEAGIISEIKPPITDFTPYENRETIIVEGEPLSEAVIRERR